MTNPTFTKVPLCRKLNDMKSSLEQLANDVLALPEEERRGIFLRLVTSLPSEVAHFAESSRRAEEMRSGRIAPMSEATFKDHIKRLRGTLGSA
jgi:hypothetical protein